MVDNNEDAQLFSFFITGDAILSFQGRMLGSVDQTPLGVLSAHVRVPGPNPDSASDINILLNAYPERLQVMVGNSDCVMASKLHQNICICSLILLSHL